MAKPIRKKRQRGRVLNVVVSGELVTGLEALSHATGAAIETHVERAIRHYLAAVKKQVVDEYLEESAKLLKPELPPKAIRVDEELRPNEPRAKRREPRKPN